MIHRPSSKAQIAAVVAVAIGAACAPVARAHRPSTIGGTPPRADIAVLKRLFLAHHRHGYVIEGYHESLLYPTWEAVYYLHVVNGVHVGSGFVPYRWSPRRIRQGRPSRRVLHNLTPNEYFYDVVLTGTGEYTHTVTSGLDDPASATAQSVDIHLTMSGRFGSTGRLDTNNEPLDLTPGSENPGPSPPNMVLGGSGTSSSTNAADPTQNMACTFTLTTPTTPPALALLWHGASTLIADLNLGDPNYVSSNPDCGGTPSDPTSSDPWIETQIQVKNPPLGRPFTVPVTLNHTTTSGDSTGSDDQDLSLDGSLAFVLVRVAPPFLN